MTVSLCSLPLSRERCCRLNPHALHTHNDTHANPQVHVDLEEELEGEDEEEIETLIEIISNVSLSHPCTACAVLRWLASIAHTP